MSKHLGDFFNFVWPFQKQLDFINHAITIFGKSMPNKFWKHNSELWLEGVLGGAPEIRRSVNPIPTRGGQIMSTTLLQAPTDLKT